VDPDTLPAVPRGASPSAPSEAEKNQIPLAAIVGVPDLEAAAESILPAKSFAYYSAGATSMHTLALNASAWDQILFRPRILVDVAEVNTSTKFLGYETTLPIFIAPAGMAKLSHPRGEAAMAEAAGKEGVIQFVSTNASAKLEDIIGAATSKDQVFMMQL
jgi:L-lactate dehydrogenase (cytochrome)